VPVIGFGSPDEEMGDIYEVPLKASGKRSITVNAVAVESTYSGPPPSAPTTSPGGSCSRGEPPPGTCTSLEKLVPDFPLCL
jgi:hypothetical protein